MKMRIACPPGLVLGLILATVSPQSSCAGLDVQLGATVQIDDDAEIYVAITSRYFDRDAASVRNWRRKCANADDLAVVLFLARQAHQSPERVLTLRGMGVSWWEIGRRLGVPAAAWFVPVSGDPGPPYGKAYGQWRRHGGTAPDKVILGDVDARNLVAVRLLHEYYGVSVQAAMKRRASGRDLQHLAVREYRHRHDRRPPAAAGLGAPSAGPPAGKPGKGRGRR